MKYVCEDDRPLIAGQLSIQRRPVSIYVSLIGCRTDQRLELDTSIIDTLDLGTASYHVKGAKSLYEARLTRHTLCQKTNLEARDMAFQPFAGTNSLYPFSRRKTRPSA